MNFREETENMMRGALEKAIKQLQSDFNLAKQDISILEGMLLLSSKLSCQECRLEGYELIRREINRIAKDRVSK